MRVLDLGCGNGVEIKELRRRGATVFAIDASEEMVRIAQDSNPNGTIRVGVFDEIPFQDQTFDLVVSKWALQNAADIDTIYKEISRVLKQDGQIILLSGHPIRQFMEKKRDGKDYFKKETVESVFFDGAITAKEPLHTMTEYLSTTFFENFSLHAYDEGYDSGSEKVIGDTYPSYLIIKAGHKM